MPPRIPYPELSLMMAVIWLGLLLVGLLTVVAFRRWRKRRPSPRAERALRYSERLHKRLSRKLVKDDAKSKRSDSAAKRGRGR